MVCACCATPLLYTFMALTVGLIFLLNASKKFSKFISIPLAVLSLIAAALFIFFGVLSSSEDARNRFFAFFFTAMAKSGHLDSHRCALLESLSGKVLEIGPGPGTNFRCLKSNEHITSWTGIESNPYFNPVINAEIISQGVTFPTSVQWIKADGSDVYVEPESFDAVFGTHVLCSVGNIGAVLETVVRALKPGGSFYFLEHVLAQTDDTSTLRLQQLTEPVFNVVGNGCLFKSTWIEIERAVLSGGVMEGFQINVTHFSADMPIPMMVPHIIGSVTKPFGKSHL